VNQKNQTHIDLLSEIKNPTLRGAMKSLASHLPEFLCRIWHLTGLLQVVEVS
jgi:hypothetical protein